MFVGSRFASHGPVALVNDVFCVPGELILKGDKLQMVALRESPPSATDLALCLAKLLAHFGKPCISPESWVPSLKTWIRIFKYTWRLINAGFPHRGCLLFAGFNGNTSVLCLDCELAAAIVHLACLLASLRCVCKRDRYWDFGFDRAKSRFEVNIERRI